MKDSRSRRGGGLALAALLLAPAGFVALSIVRAWRIADGAGNYTSCHDCFWLATFGHDAWLFAIMLAALGLGVFVRWRWLGFVLRLFAALMLVVFAADMALDSLLSTRLHFGDVLRFSHHVDADFSVVRAALVSAEGVGRIVLLVIVFAIVVGVCAASRRRPRLAAAFGIGAVAALALSAIALSRPVRYVNQIFTNNFVEANLPQGRLKTFSPDFIAAQRAKVDAIPTTCAKNPAFDGSVIIVLVESLSAWQSKLLDGVDWTPELDAIALDNHYFTHFYANGFMTSAAEVSILSGQPPLPPAGKLLFDYADYGASEGSLPAIAHRSAREAAFFTTADTSFLDLGAWLRALGFDTVGTNADAFYASMKRWQFGAPEDAALFDRVLQWIDTRDAGRPFVAMLETVSTHPPFVDPRSAKIDPENAFKYVDAQLARFYGALKQRGFLDRGVLLILGDHRTMTPLHPDEVAAYGERAFSRVPLVVAGAVDMPRVVDAPFQQTDIGRSIASLVGLESCTSAFAGDFLRADPIAPTFITHARGDDRDRVDVYAGAADVFGFRYDGDESTWIDALPPDADTIRAWIDAHRAR
jgi:phosphoglycerol transferase MdoB-like AlkP superfamily enzyme